MADFPLTHPQYLELVTIMVAHGNLNTVNDRKNFFDETGYSFVARIQENVPMEGATRDFCLTLGRTLREQGQLPRSTQHALEPLLVYLLERVQGQSTDSTKIETFLSTVRARNNPPPATVLPSNILRDSDELLQEAETYLERKEWEQALVRLQLLQTQGFDERGFDFLVEDTALKVKAVQHERRMMTDYRSIHRLLKFTKNVEKAQQEWGYFLKDYPHFTAENDPEKLSQFFEQQRLLDVMLDMQRPITERAEAGRELAKIGDPRPGVGLRADGIPDIVWCEVPGNDKGRPPVKIGGDDEAYQSLPAQMVDFPTFFISKYPITYRQFQAFVDDKGFANDKWWQKEDDRSHYDQYFKHWNHPRENVTWFAAMAFCQWLSAKLGYEVRLPTEEEWEKAARGEDGRVFPWGNQYISGYANINERFDKTGLHYLEQTSAVGIYPPQSASPYGVMDMVGNVSEWTRTLHNQSVRVLRGGSWNSFRQYARAASRRYNPPHDRNNYFGFRVVVGSAPKGSVF